MPVGRWSAQRAYNGQLLQLLRALPSGSIVPFVLVFFLITFFWAAAHITGLRNAKRHLTFAVRYCFYPHLVRVGIAIIILYSC